MKTLIIAAAVLMSLTPLCMAADAPMQDPVTEPGVTGEAAPVVQEPMDDASLAAFLKAANDTEIEAGKTAVEKARAKDIKSYARQMVKDHGRSNGDLASAVKTMGLQPQETQLSRSIREDAETRNLTISEQSGRGFDQAYIDQQVSAHQQVLDTLDRALASGQTHPEEFHKLLEKNRDRFAKHLEEAKKLQSELKESGPR